MWWRCFGGVRTVFLSKFRIQYLYRFCYRSVSKRDFFKTQGEDLLQNSAEEIGLSVYGGNTRKDINEEKNLYLRPG